MKTLQLKIGGTLLAASQCGQQTFDFIEEDESWANRARQVFPEIEQNSPNEDGFKDPAALRMK